MREMIDEVALCSSPAIGVWFVRAVCVVETHDFRIANASGIERLKVLWAKRLQLKARGSKGSGGSHVLSDSSRTSQERPNA